MDKTEMNIRRVFLRLGEDPQKVTTILDEWERMTGERISSRKWRSLKDGFNKQYRDGESDSYICGFSSGYVMTKDDDLIRHDMAIKRRQALALLMRYSDTKQALGLSRNYKADIDAITAKKGSRSAER